MNNCVKNTVCYLTNIYKYSNYFGKDCIFALQKGGLAHLARARHWQCRGDRFESGNLHKTYLYPLQGKGLRNFTNKTASAMRQNFFYKS